MCPRAAPGISVLMGTLYRRPEIGLLQRSVESILAQTYTDFEFLICDDGSTQAAKTYLEQVAAGDDRVRLVRREGCLDLAKKLNLCLAAAGGRYIARMDDDDWSYPDRLEREAAYLDSHAETAFVGCSVELEQDGKPAGSRQLPEAPEVRDFLFVQPFVHPALMFRSQVLQGAAGYSQARWCVGCEDYELLLRLYQGGHRGVNLREAALRYTLPPKGSPGRPMGLRLNEVRTRYRRFKTLGLLPRALPYVVKPVMVGLLPARILEPLKQARWEHVRD